MTTMAAKLKSQGAEVIRSLTMEIKEIKAYAARHRKVTDSQTCVRDLFDAVNMMMHLGFSPSETKKLMDVCIYESERELKEIVRRKKALEKEAKKLAKKGGQECKHLENMQK